MQIENSLKIENLKFKINSRGEIATVLTLISVGLMLLGVVAGKVAVQQTTNTQSKAACAPDERPCPGSCTAAGGFCDPGICLGGSLTGDCALDGLSRFNCCKPAATATPPSATTVPTSSSNQCSGQCKVGFPGCDSDTEDPNGSCRAGDKIGTCCVPKSSPTTTDKSCTSCDENNKCVYHPELDPRSGRAPANTPQCIDNGCVNDAECIAPKDRACMTNGESCKDTRCCLGQSGQPNLKCNADSICEPIPVPTIQCPDMKSKEEANDKCGARGYEAVPFSGGYIAGENASITNKTLIPNCWRCNTQNYCDFGSPDCEIAGKPTPFLNPTKTPNQHGFYIDSDIYAYNQDNGVRFEFNINLHSTGCDGDVQLIQNGNNLGGLKGWNARGIQDKFMPSETNSPVLGNGQSFSVTYTAKLVNYACSPRGMPDNQTDSITCNLRVSDKGYVSITGTGCNWANLNRPDDYKPTVRPTVTPGPTSSAGSTATAANVTPLVGGDCSYTPGNGSITVKNTTNKGVTGVGLKIDDKIIRSPTVAPSRDTWTFVTSLDSGDHKVQFGWDSCDDSGCGKYCKTVTISGSSVKNTPTPTGTPQCKATIDIMSDPCETCMKSNLTLNVDCPTTKQKINLYCTDRANINTCNLVLENKCYKPTDNKNGCSSTDKGLVFLSFDNKSYNTVVDGVASGTIPIKYASLYVTAANRTPGLQHEFCNPGLDTAPGGCTFGSPASSQVKT